MASARAPGVCLQTLPHEVLLNIVACTPWESPEQLLAAGSLCRALRAAVGCPSVAQLRPLWTRTIIALVDPTAALLRAGAAARAHKDDDEGFVAGRGDVYCALAHSRAGGWFALAHALAQRECAACGEVTRWVAWRESDEEEDAAHAPLLCRCCHTCAPPGCEPAHDVPPADQAAAASGSAASDAAGESSDEDKDASLCHRCTVINAQLFEPQPSCVLNVEELNDPVAALHSALAEASDGDTIGLRGEFAARYLWLGAAGGNGAAVRLLGVPANAPWRSVHMCVSVGNGRQQVNAPAGLAALSKVERSAAAAFGFPASSIFVGRNCLGFNNSAWLENLLIRSGDRAGTAAGLPIATGFPTIQLGDDESHSASGDEVIPPALVLRRCWVTAQAGSAVILTRGTAAALLQCCITNSCCAAVFCQSSTTLRMRGCHVVWNGMHLGVGDQPQEAAAAVARANVFVAHPNNGPAVDAAGPVEDVYRQDSEDVLLLN
jgi:hypothetical protein